MVTVEPHKLEPDHWRATRHLKLGYVLREPIHESASLSVGGVENSSTTNDPSMPECAPKSKGMSSVVTFGCAAASRSCELLAHHLPTADQAPGCCLADDGPQLGRVVAVSGGAAESIVLCLRRAVQT